MAKISRRSRPKCISVGRQRGNDDASICQISYFRPFKSDFRFVFDMTFDAGEKYEIDPFLMVTAVESIPVMKPCKNKGLIIFIEPHLINYIGYDVGYAVGYVS